MFMSGNLEFNKIAASVLLAGIIALTSGVVSEGLYAAGKEEGADAKRGYTVAGAETAAPAGAAPAVEAKPVDITPLLAKADVKAGEATAKKCVSCHSFDKGGKNGVGPNQFGLIGRNIASHEGYTYSAALTAMKDKKWTAQALSEFIENPKKYASGTKMAFAGIKDPAERANLIAYLSTLK